MTSLPAHLDPLDRAIVELLRSMPPTWREHDSGSLPSTEEEALRLLTLAGFVERRAWLEVRMEGEREVVEMTIVASGEGHTPLLWKHISRLVPNWMDATGRTRGRVSLAIDRVQLRVSERGERARQELTGEAPGSPSSVVVFVRRQGIHANRGPVPPTLRVERCRVTAEPVGAQGGASSGAHAAASAHASVGDIVINNKIEIDLDVLAEKVAGKMGGAVPSQGHHGAGAAAAPPSGPVPEPKPAQMAGQPAPPPMPPAVELAGASLEWVRRVRDYLLPPAGSKERYNRQQWEHIREHDSEIYKPDKNGRSTVPNFDTWSRYVRQYLKFMDGPVNHPRRGRTGRSLARPEELWDR